MKKRVLLSVVAIGIMAHLFQLSAEAQVDGTKKQRNHKRAKDNNPPGRKGGPGTNWENPPGPKGGPGTNWENPSDGKMHKPPLKDGTPIEPSGKLINPDLKEKADANKNGIVNKTEASQSRRWEKNQDNNTPGRKGGKGTSPNRKAKKGK